MSLPAAFLAQLAGDSAGRCVLIEITHAIEVAGAPATGTVYLSNTFYATGPSDQPANVSYIDAVRDVPRYSRRIDSETLGGRAVLSLGQLELDNSDGRLAFLLTLVVDGQPCSIYLGNEGWPRSQFQRVVYALVDRVSAPSPDRLVVTLRDPGLLLNTRVGGSLIGGSTVNAERRKPLVLGAARNVAPVLSDTTNLRYWVQHAGRSLTPYHYADVRDNGVSLIGSSISGNDATVVFSAGADTITYAGHPFVNEDVVLVTTTGTVPAPLVNNGQYWVRDRTATTIKLAATRLGAAIDITASSFTGTLTIAGRGWFDNGDGSIDLAHSPVGTVTADCSGEVRLHNAIEQLVLTHAGFPPSLYYGPAFDAIAGWWASGNVPQVALVAYEAENVVELLDQLVLTAHAFWGFTSEGLLTFGRIRLDSPAGAMSLTIEEDDILSRDAVGIERLQPLYDHVSCVINKNWTVQGSVAASVTPENAQRYAAPGLRATQNAPFGTAYATNPGLYHRSLSDSPEIETLYGLPGGDDATNALIGTAWSLEHATLFAPHVDIVTLETRLTGLAGELGDTVTFATSLVPSLRLGGLYGVGSGVLLGSDVDLSRGRVTLTIAAKRTPDYTTAAHYG